MKSAQQPQYYVIKPMTVSMLIFLLCFAGRVTAAKETEQDANSLHCKKACTGDDCAYIDRTFDSYRSQSETPCKNFFKHVCEKWTGPDLKTELSTKIMKTLKEILITPSKATVNNIKEGKTSSSGSTEEKQKATTKAKLVYQRCLKSGREEELKVKEGIKKILQKYGINKWPEEHSEVGERALLKNILGASGLRPFSTMKIISDLRDSPKYILDINHPRFEFVGIPSWNKTARSADQYKELIKMAMNLMNDHLNNNKFTKFADEIYDFEQRLANQVPPQGDQGRMLKSIRNFRKEDELELREPLNVDFNKTGGSLTNEDNIVIRSLHYFKNISEMMKTEKRYVLKNYIGWFLIREIADVASPKLLAQLNKLKEGTSRPPIPELNSDGCIHRLTGKNGLLDSVIVHLYLQNNDKSQAKRHIQVIASYLNSSFHRMISTNKWMKEKTQKRSKQRIANTVYKIGYYDELLNESYVEDLNKFVMDVTDDVPFVLIYDSLQQNVLLQNLLRYGKPYDTSNIWRISSVDTEGGYSDFIEDIEMPAGGFWFPVDNDTLPNSINFGSMGTRIAEKLTDGFGELAKLYRRNATLKRDLWSRKAKRNFEKYAECFDESKKETPKERSDEEENGEDSNEYSSEDESGEYYDYNYDYGDNEEDTKISNALKFRQHVGLRSTYNAYVEMVKNCKKTEVTSTEGQKTEQNQLKHFFLGYALTSCVNASSSTYSDTEESVNFALKTYEQFWNAFGCKKGDAMRTTDTCKFMGDSAPPNAEN